MKRFISLAFIALFTFSGAIAQKTSARIDSLLSKMPANDAVWFNRYMNDAASLGEKGLLRIIKRLGAPEKNDNSRIEYLINGFSSYASQPGQETLRKICVNTYCKALSKLDNKENQAFIIWQFEMVGKDDAVACLKNYLSDIRLCDPAARALIRINTANANQTLLLALKDSKGAPQLSLVEALGDSKYKNAAPIIQSLVSGQNKDLDKVALYALARIADPSSETVLESAAQRTGFAYETSNAVSSYLLYAQNLAKAGHQVQAEKIANNILQKINSPAQAYIRIGALKIMVESQEDKSVAFLARATVDPSIEYRSAALRFASAYINPATTAIWIAQMKKSDAALKANIIKMLGDSHATEALPVILSSLESKEKAVKLAAIAAAGKIGQDKVLDHLLKVLKEGDKQDAAAVQQVLLAMKGSNVTISIANAIPAMPASAQPTLIAVLANRGEPEKLNTIYPLLKAKDESVKHAAFTSLKKLVTKSELEKLFSLYHETSSPAELVEIQEAIIASMKEDKENPNRAAMMLQQLAKAPKEKKRFLYKGFAYLGGKQSLAMLENEFKNGDEQTKKAALEALSLWSDANAGDLLFKISFENQGSPYFDKALKGYIRSVSIAPVPGEQKFILLRKAMALAKTNDQKELILKEIEAAKTFPAMVFAGQYLDDPDLQQRAGITIMNIALANKNYNGAIVKDLLNRTILVLKGRDGEFQKQSIRKHLSELPSGDGFVSMFNGKDLSGWKGLVGDPIKRSKMDEATLKAAQEKADAEMRSGWQVINGELIFNGKGNNIATLKKYRDFEMLVDWKIFDDGNKKGDAGIYLRGSPQVQIWDTSRVSSGAQVGSGGLYNNKIHPSKPLKVADNRLDEWNTFRIIMTGDKVTVYLNGILVTDNVTLENYWDRNLPIFPEEQIELQAHGSRVAYRDIYIKEIVQK